MGHDPQPRVGQASDQAIKVNDWAGVAHQRSTDSSRRRHPAGPSDSRVTCYPADDANPAVTSPRPAVTTHLQAIQIETSSV
jgi:hypothetical protein